MQGYNSSVPTMKNTEHPDEQYHNKGISSVQKSEFTNVTHHDGEQDEDIPSLLPRCNYDSDSDLEVDEVTPETPKGIRFSKVFPSSLETNKPTSSNPITPPIRIKENPASNSTITEINLDTSMQYHLNDDKLDKLKQRVTSKAMQITSDSNITHPTPLISHNRS